MASAKYCGTFTDYSGYGQANRTFITALFLAGVDISTELVVQVPERGQFGWIGRICDYLEKKRNNYKIKIIHLTPDMYPKYMEKGKYNIGHLFWETDKLPREWVTPCNQMDEIWTASEAQATMIKNSGVTVPIFAFPQPIDIIPSDKDIPPFVIQNFSGFTFYSIFQWIERKNPKALVTTFWKTFTGNDEVALVIKTHRLNYSTDEFERIKDDIRAWREEVKLPHYPKIYLIKKLHTTEQLFRLHKTADAYINTSRGEGWCIPAVEAGMMGKPIISIDHTGFADILPKELFYPCKTSSTGVVPVRWIPWYTADQEWLEISEEQLSKQMLMVYNNKEEAEKRGLQAQKFIKDNFNFWTIGNLMKERLQAIERIV